MDVKELRIGNFVLDVADPDEKTVRRVAAVCEEGYVKFDEYSNRWFSDEIKPVPLTDDILDACGFLTRCQYPKHFNRSIQCKVKNAVTLVKGGFISSSLKKEVYYFQGLGGVASFNPIATVHQLQNLYFSLAGKELDIDGTKLQTI